MAKDGTADYVIVEITGNGASVKTVNGKPPDTAGNVVVREVQLKVW